MFSIANFGAGITSAILPLYAVNMGATLSQLGLLFSFIHVSSAVVRMPAGLMSDRHGYQKFYLLGLLLAVLALVAAGSASTWSYLIAAAIFAGLSQAFYYIMQNSIIIRDVSSARRSAAFTWLFVSMNLGELIGPAIGGAVAEVFDLRTPFLVSLGIIAAAFFCAFLVFGTHDPPTRQSRSIQDILFALKEEKRLVLRLSFARMLYHMPFTVFTPLAVLLLRTEFAATYFEIGVITAASGIGSVLGSLTSGRLGRMISRRLIIVYGLLGLIPVALTTAFAPSLYIIVVTLGMNTFVWGALIPNYDSLIGDLSPPKAVALIFSTATAFGRLGMILSSVIGGIVAESFGIRSAFVAIAIMSGSAAVGGLLVPRKDGYSDAQPEA